jgi:hypothetical protein
METNTQHRMESGAWRRHGKPAPRVRALHDERVLNLLKQSLGLLKQKLSALRTFDCGGRRTRALVCEKDCIEEEVLMHMKESE